MRQDSVNEVGIHQLAAGLRFTPPILQPNLSATFLTQNKVYIGVSGINFMIEKKEFLAKIWPKH
jgi:hypothetical protein